MILEEVQWIDSGLNFANEWVDLDEIVHRAKEWNGVAMTVGYVAYEAEDRIVLVQTLDLSSPNAANAFLIYKENIISRKVLG